MEPANSKRQAASGTASNQINVEHNPAPAWRRPKTNERTRVPAVIFLLLRTMFGRQIWLQHGLSWLSFATSHRPFRRFHSKVETIMRFCSKFESEIPWNCINYSKCGRCNQMRSVFCRCTKVQSLGQCRPAASFNDGQPSRNVCNSGTLCNLVGKHDVLMIMCGDKRVSSLLEGREWAIKTGVGNGHVDVATYILVDTSASSASSSSSRSSSRAVLEPQRHPLHPTRIESMLWHCYTESSRVESSLV